ncbi:patatin phospholipase [Fusarium langsethiae]|uniref:Patatin phospholipase n=1 Tax=Fusarium langsethiae TaxID=179993 RepID=A0A0N0DC50_FUSLA|nr:patatin phospholipase [Fusarium langsethiae]
MDLPSFNSKRRFRCCVPKAETLLASRTSVMESQELVCSRLLYPFVDVFCFHSYSLSDLAKIARWIATWPTEDCPVWQPSLVVLLHDKHLQQPNAAVVAEQVLASTIQTLTSRALSCYFFDSKFINISDGGPPAMIQGHLRQYVSVVRQRRRDSGLLLSAEHLNTLFERAFESAATLHQQPFSPIRSARRDLPVSTDLTGHLVNFMNHLPSAGDLLSFASPIIASSLLCDHYLPDMHLFNPQDVFKYLYQDACVEACKQTATMNRSDGLLLPSSLASSIMETFTSLFDRLRQGETAVSVHRSALITRSDRWENIKSNKTCFSCLTQVPQHKISCGHWICENCLQAFGESGKADPYLFSLTHCLLDGKVTNLLVRIRPPTAGHSILCIDGGGIRGIIPPAILNQVQKRLGLPIPIQEFFTLAYGVSAGALIVLALFVNGWPPSTWSLPGVNWIRAILSDALYAEDDIEAALKRAFGEAELTEASYAQKIGAKIGIPAATICQPSLCLFTNYNGTGRERTGYRVLTGAESVKTWEVRGRSTSAAPLYFPAKYLPGIGTLQDAGVVANNPIIIALAEFAAMNGNPQPDLVLNVGTGTSPDIPLVDREPRFIRDNCLVRLKRGYMSLMQGKKIWNDVTSIGNRPGRNGSRYRLDLTITQPPSLDDTASMPMLTSMVYHDAMLLKSVPDIAYHLFATLFYFELDTLPQRAGSKFRISGHILCTRKGRDPAIPKIAEKLRRSTIYINGRSTRPGVETDEHGNIRQAIECTTGQPLLIELKEEGSTRAFPLSGSPYNVPKLIARGPATAVFGTRIHKKRTREVACSRPSKRRRRCVACLSF